MELTHSSFLMPCLAIYWFRTFPLWLDLSEIRVVHATWDQQQINLLAQTLNELDGVSTDFLVEGNTQGTPLFAAIVAIAQLN